MIEPQASQNKQTEAHPTAFSIEALTFQSANPIVRWVAICMPTLSVEVVGATVSKLQISVACRLAPPSCVISACGCERGDNRGLPLSSPFGSCYRRVALASLRAVLEMIGVTQTFRSIYRAHVFSPPSLAVSGLSVPSISLSVKGEMKKRDNGLCSRCRRHHS